MLDVVYAKVVEVGAGEDSIVTDPLYPEGVAP
jgi:hypothetical protein